MTNQPNLCHVWVDSSQNQHGSINRLDVRISTQLWQNLTWFHFMFQLIYFWLNHPYIVQVDPSVTIATYHLTRPTSACCSKVVKGMHPGLICWWLLCYMLNWIEQSLMMAVQKGSDCGLSDSELLSCCLVQCNKEVALTPCYSTCPVGVVKWVWLRLLKVDSIT